MITQKPKGTQDWYGEQMNKRTLIEKKAREICAAYNIKEISTPVFEHTVLFQRGVGETTDVVQKEMYSFVDKGDRSVTLKPEGTAGDHHAMKSRRADDCASITSSAWSLSVLKGR